METLAPARATGSTFLLLLLITLILLLLDLTEEASLSNATGTLLPSPRTPNATHHEPAAGTQDPESNHDHHHLQLQQQQQQQQQLASAEAAGSALYLLVLCGFFGFLLFAATFDHVQSRQAERWAKDAYRRAATSRAPPDRQVPPRAPDDPANPCCLIRSNPAALMASADASTVVAVAARSRGGGGGGGGASGDGTVQVPPQDDGGELGAAFPVF
ncbi:unnamed protein product [Lampetra fluviatilis]